METNTRRSFFGRVTAMMALATSASKVLAQQSPAVTGSKGSAPPQTPGVDTQRRANHIHNGIYYFSGTGSNDGYSKDDHVLVTDHFEKHVTRH